VQQPKQASSTSHLTASCEQWGWPTLTGLWRWYSYATHELQASEAESRASQVEAELDELRESAASSGSTIEQWQSAYSDLQQQQATAEAELQQLREAAGSSGSSIEEWRNAYADLQQHYSSLQASDCLMVLVCKEEKSALLQMCSTA